jgi:hypothetical protein
MGTGTNFCGVEVWRSGLGSAYRLPTLSSVGAGRADLPHPALGEDSRNRRSHCM